MKRIYLASPYSHKHPITQERRFVAVCQAAAKLIEAGHFVFSPIAHCHNIALHGSLAGDYSYWKEYNEDMLARWSDVLVVLMLEGWDTSAGVNAEKAYAQQLSRPIIHWLTGLSVASLDLSDL